MAELVIMSFLAIAGAMALVAAIDVPFRLWDHHRKLKMTKEEVRQENKETEGDPHVKGRIRAQQRAMARKRMMAEVPMADVIVTNPTALFGRAQVRRWQDERATRRRKRARIFSP